jgi:hypothetical protein
MKTAVEWLIEQLNLKESMYLHTHKVIDQAKEIEKEQLCLTYVDGFNLRQQTTDVSDNYITAEQYYNETFKSE